MAVDAQTVKLTLVGGAGVAAATGTLHCYEPVKLLGLSIDYTSQPGTVDVTIANRGRNVLVASNQNTDRNFRPLEQAVDAAGANISGAYGDPILYGDVTVSAAQGNAATNGVAVTFYVDVV